MKPVFQDKFGNKEGNCFQACVASLLELQLHEVPDFCAHPGEDWFDLAVSWIRARGVFVLHLGPPFTVEEANFMPRLPYIAGGDYEGPTGSGPHAVIHQQGRLLHNPNPNHEGRDLASVDVNIFLVRAP